MLGDRERRLGLIRLRRVGWDLGKILNMVDIEYFQKIQYNTD